MMTDDDPRLGEVTREPSDEAEFEPEHGAYVDSDFLLAQMAAHEIQLRTAALGYALQLPRPHDQHTPEAVLQAATAFYKFLSGDDE